VDYYQNEKHGIYVYLRHTIRYVESSFCSLGFIKFFVFRIFVKDLFKTCIFLKISRIYCINFYVSIKC
jgi:hypothetical protein